MHHAEAELELELESAAERMDAGDVYQTVSEAWRSLPPDVKNAITSQGKQIWDLRGAYLARFLATLNAVFFQNPAGWQQMWRNNRAAAARQMAMMAGQMAGLRARRVTHPPGMSPTQVRGYHRRQRQRGRIPGQNRQTRRQREMELELELAGQALEQELEQPESFYTRVTPIPGIGNAEGHEILTRRAMSGLGLSAADRSAIELGVIRPDRGGRSYWNFPGAAIGAMAASAQPAHSLRPTPAASSAAALSLIQRQFAALHRNAMTAPTRQVALEWLGEALHLLQDSYSAAHTERAGGTGRIQKVRAFFIRVGWPPRSTAPGEHNAPSDTRDDVFSGGALRPQASAAITASRDFLVMALRHLGRPGSPSNAGELAAFIGRYLS
jgi:hypothetical protein